MRATNPAKIKCHCGDCRVCKQRARRHAEYFQRRRRWTDLEIRAHGPQLWLSCKMVEMYAAQYGETVLLR